MQVSIRQIFNYTPTARVLLHVVFWTLIFSMQYFSYSRIDFESSWILFLKDVFALLTLFYVTAYIIIPKFFVKGRFLVCLAWVAVMYTYWALLSYFSVLLTLALLQPGSRLAVYLDVIREAGIAGPFMPSTITYYLLDFIFLVSLPMGMKVMQAFVNVRNQKVQLELKNSELALNNVKLELAFLKSQINPHFLFNTLNNIYVLVSENDARGADSLVRLSGIMYYLLHVSERHQVSLEEEYLFLEQYIELEKLRFSDDVDVKVAMVADSYHYDIVPLIIFPMIENAFKHGPKTRSKDAWISIDISVSHGRLRMNVSNGYKPVPKPSGYIGGIGVENVRRRLELNYPDRYNLTIVEENDRYQVELVLDLVPEANRHTHRHAEKLISN